MTDSIRPSASCSSPGGPAGAHQHQLVPIRRQHGRPGKTGAYTGLYYLFSSLAAIASPPLVGLLFDRLGYGILFKYALAGFVLAWSLLPPSGRRRGRGPNGERPMQPLKNSRASRLRTPGHVPDKCTAARRFVSNVKSRRPAGDQHALYSYLQKHLI
jgi:MFS family permease